MPLLAGPTIPAQPKPPNRTGVLPWSPKFPSKPQLVTNEFAHWNRDPDTAPTGDWDMDSGSLFVDKAGNGWTGHIDNQAPDALSQHGTNSAVFRLVSVRKDFLNVRVSFDLYLDHLTSTATTPVQNWDGVHVFLRYQSEFDLYYASVARRDGHVVVKRKTPGGDTNGGTYRELADEAPGHGLPRHTWTPVAATIRTVGAGVEISIERGGKVIHRAVDPDGLLEPGAVGIRGDNASFKFRNFEVRAA